MLFSFTTYATSQYRETRRLLTEVQDYINEKPDSAIVVLKSYQGTNFLRRGHRGIVCNANHESRIYSN